MFLKTYVVLAAGMLSAAVWAGAETLVLDPMRPLTPERVRAVAEGGTKVVLSDKAQQRVRTGHEVVLQAALHNKPVYGLTVGVGWNKDKPVFKEVGGQKVLSPELLDLSRRFNVSSLRAHASGLGEAMPEAWVRAGMLIRLNTFLKGEAGVSPEVARIYTDFLNRGITPVVPSRGSIGEADITLASHIGLAMIGEWDVFYGGRRMSAAEAMRQAGIAPLRPVGKDFLSILSTNALMAAQAADVLAQSRAFYRRAVAVFALALEGYNGNVAPFSHAATAARPYPQMQAAAADIRAALKGSALWQPDDKRALQDPLSYRSMAYTLGEVREAMQRLEEVLAVQINHTDDNPLVLASGLPEADDSEQMRRYQINGKGSAAIVPTANFNFLPVSRAAAQLNAALAKLAEVMTQQILRTENDAFTKLPRFLAAHENPEGHAFGAIQKPFASVNQKIKSLMRAHWADGMVLAGNIEDTASMSEQVLADSRAILNGLYEIAAYQMLHAAQAADLRQGFRLGESSRNLLEQYRRRVPFASQDTATTPLIASSIDFLKNY